MNIFFFFFKIILIFSFKNKKIQHNVSTMKQTKNTTEPNDKSDTLVTNDNDNKQQTIDSMAVILNQCAAAL